MKTYNASQLHPTAKVVPEATVKRAIEPLFDVVAELPTNSPIRKRIIKVLRELKA